MDLLCGFLLPTPFAIAPPPVRLPDVADFVLAFISSFAAIFFAAIKELRSVTHIACFDPKYLSATSTPLR
jgi:hypothetical protein